MVGNRYGIPAGPSTMMKGMRGPVRLSGVALVTVAVVLSSGSAAVAGRPARHGKPVFEPAPNSTPLTARHDGACTTELDPPPTPPHPGHRLLWVNRTPNRVVAIWVPGANAERCVAQRTVDNATLARPLAHAIQQAPAFPRGIFCPLDDGSAVRLYLTYPNGQNEYVNIELSGCRAITAPGRSGRKSTHRLTRLLREAAPPAWLPYLAGE